MLPQFDELPLWSFPGCPEPPTWYLNWQALEARLPWLAPLGDTPQDPRYHAEGDVLTHTRMVVEALIALDEWRALPQSERHVLFAAALLHDIGKPRCTLTTPDGRIEAPGHARRGEPMARALLWRGEGLGSEAPPAFREAVAALVRLHGLPLWFLEKSDPARAVIGASQRVRLDRVALLAEADVRGRSCADQGELLARLTLFRDMCREQECYTGPRSFASAHSRFVYFHKPQGRPDYHAYDDTRCTVVLMAGLPAAGKDTWLTANLPGWPVISLDALRRGLGIAPEDAQGPVVQAARERARVLLQQGRSFVWNATNLTRALRGPLIDLSVAYGARVRIVFLDAPRTLLLRRNRLRPAAVPERVIERLLTKLEPPDYTEAHEVQWNMA